MATPDSMNEAADTTTGTISVSELNRRIKGMLEANFELRWVRGELSNVMRAASGHWYFSLKDNTAQVRCVMFRQRAQSVSFTPENGQEVDVRAVPTLYEARGEFQLGVETMRRAGAGALFEAFERLKQKLAAEGLFDDDRKRALPGFAHSLGIVTSVKGAALHDVLTTLQRRAPMINIIIYPTAVQGADAPREIANAINAAASRNEIDAMLICRGGGAMEDLWAFNDEAVARAIAKLQTETGIIVVSGVGHETDFTICDFVADRRAPTPTAGAELLSPDTPQLRIAVQQKRESLVRSADRLIRQYQQRVDFVARGLVSPHERIKRERENHLLQKRRLDRARNSHHRQLQIALLAAAHHLRTVMPDLGSCRSAMGASKLAIAQAMASVINLRLNALAHNRQALNLLNPEHVLTRGYAIVEINGKGVVSGIASVHANDQIAVRMHDGEIAAVVIKTAPS